MIDPEQYQAQVANAAITAILDLYPDGTGAGGVIDPTGAINGLCVAIAMIAMNTDRYDTPAKRRALADTVRKNTTIALNNAAVAVENGMMADWMEAKPITPERH